MKISEHITYEEATFSDTAIRAGVDNTPEKEHLDNMIEVANRCFEPVRAHFGVPIKVSSFYRSKKVNSLVKGSSKTSQHMVGQAIDLQAISGTGITNADIYQYIKNNLDFDQLIWEYGNDVQPAWVHVSYSKEKNRKQLLRY